MSTTLDVTAETRAQELAAQIWCRPENAQREMDTDFALSIAVAIQPHIEAVDDLQEALQWASGSPDFNPGGQAREGWVKLAQPALAKAIAL